MYKPKILPDFALFLAAGILLAGSGFSCGGGSGDTEDLLTAPNFIGVGSEGIMLVGEGALGKIWTVSTEDYKIPKKVGADGKEAQTPALSLGQSVLEMKTSPDGQNLLALTWEGDTFNLRSYETQGFSEQGKQEYAERPLAFEVGNGGAIYLIQKDSTGGGGIIYGLPNTLSYSGAKTVPVVPVPVDLELAPDAEHLLIKYGPGESRFGWMDLNDFSLVSDIPWNAELAGIGEYRAVFLPAEEYPGGGLIVIPEGRDYAIKFSLDQSWPATTLNLKGLTGGIMSGEISGDPVLIWVTLTGYLHLFDFSTGCYGDLGSDASSAGEATFNDIEPISNPKIDKIETSNCLGVTKTETWTITYNGTGWQVNGTVSGMQPSLAKENEVYSTAGGEVSFLLSAGEFPANEGDNFTFDTDEGIDGIYFAAAAPELYLDESQGKIWISDTSGGKVFVVDPLTGSTQQIIY